MVDLNSFADKESFFEEQFVVSIQTPTRSVDEFAKVLGDNIELIQGNYSHCMYIRSNGYCRFKGNDGSHNDCLFPNYCDGNQVKSNSASSALNKWLKANVSKDIVVHSLRHAMRDRMMAVECPANIIDQIGGWSRKGVGESYGLGYQVEQLHRWMGSI